MTPSMMQAVVCHGPRDYQLEEVPVPVPGAGEVLLSVEAVGICASDLKCYHGAAKFWGDEGRPAWAETEVTPGHEFVGRVTQGDEAALDRWGIEVGDRVVAEQIVPCGECRYCQRGAHWLCAVHNIFGFKRATSGAMAPFMVLPAASRVHKVSPDIPAAHAAYAEPLSCALHAVERARITFDDVVVVAGCGPIGLGMVAGAAALSPAHVVVLDESDFKLELARECGADTTVNITKEDPQEVIRAMTDGYGADVYLEGSGHPSAVLQGLQLLRKQGTYVEYGVFGAPATVDWSIISDDKELDVRGAHLGARCWPPAIRMIESGVLPLDRICGTQLPLEDFQKGLDLVADGSGSIKVTLIP